MELSYLKQVEVVVANCDSGETLEQAAQRSCGCFITGSVQSQYGWGFKQPDLLESVPNHGRGV